MKLLLIMSLLFTSLITHAQQDQSQISTDQNSSTIDAQTENDRNQDIDNSINRQNIRELLRRESLSTSTEQALSYKRAGLRYVRDLFDFEILTRLVFQNHPIPYQVAVGEFIAENIHRFTFNSHNFRSLYFIELRAYYVHQAQRVKEAGMQMVYSIPDFLTLIENRPRNMSVSYLDMISAFIARNIHLAVQPHSNINLILQVEGYTKYVSHAITVKEAGLLAVHGSYDFFNLTSYAFENTSFGYEQAVEKFILENDIYQ